MPRSAATDAQKEVVRVLKNARAEAGLTQQQLADRLGKPQSFVAKYERGERRLDIIELIRIARAMEVRPGKIFSALEKLV